MKMLIRIISSSLLLALTCKAQLLPPSPPPLAKPTWSLVYLPSLDWSEQETQQTLDLLRQLKPGLVVSLSPCPFADSIRGLESKPSVLDPTGRVKSGTACGVAAVPLSAYLDTSTCHPFGDSESGKPGLVWLSAEAVRKPFNGPVSDEDELRALARIQIRKQLAERRGEVVFLEDTSVPTPAEETWILPNRDAKYEQAVSGVTGFTCIRPESLRTHLNGVKGVTPRTPLIHWIHSGEYGIIWETLPIDGGPAIERSVSTYTSPRGAPGRGLIAWLKPPVAPSGMPMWMDGYIDANQALGCGENIKSPIGGRRFGWKKDRVDRDEFDVLPAPIDSAPEVKPEVVNLPRGAVRSPGGLFSVTVGQLGEKGTYPEDGDDGFNLYLDDLHGRKSRLINFAGLYSAWPTAATWFTDRYLITTGTESWVDPPSDSDSGPRFHPLTIRVFDLLNGSAFTTAGMARTDRVVAPTERIFFPDGNYYQEQRWKTLWKAVEDGYGVKPEKPPITADDAAANAKLPVKHGLQWKDLGIWPPPETWRLLPDVEELGNEYPPKKSIPTGDPYLSYKHTAEGQQCYSLAISGYHHQTQFVDNPPETDAVAHADLFTTGKGSLSQFRTVQRIGDRRQHLLIAGTYQKPGTYDPQNGNWMLLIDLLSHRSWYAHW